MIKKYSIIIYVFTYIFLCLNKKKKVLSKTYTLFFIFLVLFPAAHYAKPDYLIWKGVFNEILGLGYYHVRVFK